MKFEASCGVIVLPIVLLNPAAPIHLYSFQVHSSPAKVRGFRSGAEGIRAPYLRRAKAEVSRGESVVAAAEVGRRARVSIAVSVSTVG